MCINLVKTNKITTAIEKRIQELNIQAAQEKIIVWLKEIGLEIDITLNNAIKFKLNSELGICVVCKFFACRFEVIIDWKNFQGNWENFKDELEFSIFNFGEAERELLENQILNAIERCEYITPLVGEKSKW